MDYKVILLALFFVGTNAVAQKVDYEEQQRLRDKYPEDAMVYLTKRQDLDIRISGDSLLMTSKQFEERAYLGELSNAFAKDNVYENSFNKISDLTAYSLVPNGKKYERLDVKEFKTGSDMESYVFYDDSKTYNFIYPGIQPDTRTVLSYSTLHSEPRFGDTFYFQSFVPVHESVYSITYDPKVELNISEFHLDEYNVERKEETLSNGRKRITFIARELMDMENEPSSPRANYYAPHVILRIEHFTDASGNQKTLLAGPDNLHDWYREFVKDLSDHEDDEVAEIVDSIIDPGDSEVEKVRKIYYWVQDNIKYIAFEDGMRGFIPHPGGYVCEKRYGDCKDMASIIVNMLNYAGVEAYFTWVGSRNLPYRYTELPTPNVDNHMIATYKMDGEYHFLDATSQYLTFPMPSSMIQGKETLISEGDTYHIVEVPVIPPSENVMTDTVKVKIAGNRLEGKGNVQFTGYARTFNAHKMIKADESSLEKYLIRLLAKGNNKFIMDDYNVSNLYDRDSPIEVTYDFSVSDYHREINDEIYINLNLDKSFQNSQIDDKRKLAIENDYLYTNKTVSILEIPEGYIPTYVPENVEFDNDVFSFELSYKQENGSILLDRTFQVKYLLLEPGDFDKFNNAITELTKSYREAIILSKKEENK